VTTDNAKPAVAPSPTLFWQADWLNSPLGLGMKLIMAAGAVLLFLDGNYQAGIETLVILIITFLPLLMRSQFQVRIPVEFETLTVAFIYLSLFLGEIQGFYTRYWWWDLVLHGGAGMLAGMTGFLCVFLLNHNVKAGLHLSAKFIAVFAFMFAIGIGSLWEIFEFTMDSLLGLNMQKSGLVDTMWDLIINLLGALSISLVGYDYLKSPATDSLLVRSIHKFTAANPRIFRRR
jgi:hypothetical protein